MRVLRTRVSDRAARSLIARSNSDGPVGGGPYNRQSGQYDRVMRFVAVRVIAVIIAAMLLVIPTTTLASVRTAVTVFHAFTATGTPTLPTTPASGYCSAGSLATDRRDAWQCRVGKDSYDPCFSSSAAPGIVLCPNAQLSGAMKVRLTHPLPTQHSDRGTASIRSQPWLIEVKAKHEARCLFVTGAKPYPDGTRPDYRCTGSLSGFGAVALPNRTKDPWTITIAVEANNTTIAGTVPVIQAWV
jgi:hypothetical protein